MSVNTHIYLPCDVRFDDVANVMGILAGLDARLVPFDATKPWKGWYVKVDGVDWRQSHTPRMCIIELESAYEQADGQSSHEAFYHFENPDGSRCVSVGSTPFWIAVGRGLVKFFGGRMTYQDTTDKVDFRAKKPRACNSPEDGRPWCDFQKAVLAVKAVTKAELRAAAKLAAYNDVEPF